jgi:hypothetical protein
MPSHSPFPCVHSHSLRDNFARQLALARASEQLTLAQASLLEQLCLHPWRAPLELRLDCLQAAGWRSLEFADALMISYVDTTISTVYLALPLCAIERFADRQSLHAALLSRYGEGADNAIAAQVLDGSPFVYWMTNFVHRQHDLLQRVEGTLFDLPTLQSVLHAGLQADLAKLSPLVDTDPDEWAYQITETATPEEVRDIRPLQEIALDELCAVAPRAGSQRWLLNPEGNRLAADAASTLDSSRARTTARFNARLDQFWQASSAEGQSRRAVAIQALQHLYYLALVQAVQAQGQAAVDVSWLRRPLQRAGGLAQQAFEAHRITLESGQRAGIDLSGVFILRKPGGLQAALYFFAPGSPLQRFKDLPALLAWLTDATNETLLARAMGTQNHAPWRAMKRARLRSTPILGDLFAERLTSLIQLQAADLAQALARLAEPPARAAARLDDALDLRAWLAPALLEVEVGGRWLAAASTDADLAHRAEQLLRPGKAADQWRIAELQAVFELLHDAQPSLRGCIARSLDAQLALLGAPCLKARTLSVTRPAAGAIPQELITLALDRLAAVPAPPLEALCTIRDDKGQFVDRLDGVLLDVFLERTCASLKYTWVRQLTRYTRHPQRLGAVQVDAHTLSRALRQRILREEKRIADDLRTDQPWAVEWLGQVLDRPTRRMRLGLGDARVEVNRISLRLPNAAAVIPLTNVMVLTQGTAPEGQALLCSHLAGLMAFPTRADLQAALGRLMRAPQDQDRWLQLVCERYQPALKASLATSEPLTIGVELLPVDGDYTQYLQGSDEGRQLFTAEDAFIRGRAAGYSGALWLACVDQAAGHLALGEQLDELADTLAGRALKEHLPAWVCTASTTDLDQYLANLQRLRASLMLPQRYLFGIESAQEYATEKLWTALSVDFPFEAIDPAKVRVRVAQHFPSGLLIGAAAAGMITSAAGVDYPLLDLPLPEYSLQRAIGAPGLPIEIHMTDESPLVAGLTPEYVQQLVSQLDTGGRYLRHLEKAFGPHDPDYAKRRSLFHQQIPPLLLDAALEAKLKGTLSAAAYAIVAAMLEMPDPLARQTDAGQAYTLRPLSLVAIDELPADPAAGMYVLGPPPDVSGPRVLLVTFHEAFVYREFLTEAELMRAFQAAGDLQVLLLERLANEVRARYTHGGLLVARLETSVGPDSDHPLPRPGLTRLGYAPVTGNCMTYLFEQSLQFMLRLSRAQVVTSAQADHVATLSLLKLLAETGLTFIGGRIAMAQCAWQSTQWLHSALQAFISHDWGRAVSEFSAALLMLVSHRTPRAQRLSSELATSTATDLTASGYLSRFSDLPMLLRNRLRALEATGVELGKLTPDITPGIYLDTLTSTRYAAVAGLVYKVRKLEGTWTIVGEAYEGPALRRTAQGEWAMAMGRGLMGGGGGWSASRRLRDQQAYIGEVFITEAVGMPAMRREYPANARRVAAAHLRAQRYLQQCLEALTLAADSRRLPIGSEKILMDFFDVSAPTVALALAARVRKITATLLCTLLHKSLNARTSLRFVSGSNRPGAEGTVAFTVDKDPHRKIYLTEVFFGIPSRLRHSLRESQRDFDLAAHFRATTLIHELSHIACGTEDVAYIEASAPYLDMIEATSPRGTQLVADISQGQHYALSAKTPEPRLFTERSLGGWRDLAPDDGASYAKILSLSRSRTLHEARRAFLDDAGIRMDIILANADSVALLVTLLARTRRERS